MPTIRPLSTPRPSLPRTPSRLVPRRPLPPRAIRVLDIDPSGRESRAVSLDAPAGYPADGVLVAAQALLDRHPLLSSRLAIPTGSGANALRAWSPAFAGATRDARLAPA